MDSLTPSPDLANAAQGLENFLADLALEDSLARARLVVELLSEATAEDLAQPQSLAERRLLAWVSWICDLDGLYGLAALESAKAAVLLGGVARLWPDSFLRLDRAIAAECRDALLFALPLAAPLPLPVPMPDQSLVPVSLDLVFAPRALALRAMTKDGQRSA